MWLVCARCRQRNLDRAAYRLSAVEDEDDSANWEDDISHDIHHDFESDEESFDVLKEKGRSKSIVNGILDFVLENSPCQISAKHIEKLIGVNTSSMLGCGPRRMTGSAVPVLDVWTQKKISI